MLNGKFELYKLQQLRKNGFECQEEQEYHPQTSQKQPESEDQRDIEEIRAYGKLNSRLKLVTWNQQSTSYFVTKQWANVVGFVSHQSFFFSKYIPG
mgnify:CR=1 FL=1